MSLHDGVFMLWARSTHCKLFEMILTSSDPRGLKRKSLEKDKLCEEGSRLAWMDLEALVEAWTKGCIEMSEIIILLLSFLKIPVLMPLPSVWEQSSGRPSMREREEGEGEREIWRATKDTFTCSFQPSSSSIWSKQCSCLYLDSNNIILLVTAT